LGSTQRLPDWTRALARRFASALDELVGAIPLTAASLSVRTDQTGPLEVVSTRRFEGETGETVPPLSLGDEAVRWLEANRRELVLSVRPEHAKAGFYRPFIDHGIRTALIAGVFRGEKLVGAVAVGSSRTDAYTRRHLGLIRLMTRELAADFRAAAAQGEVERKPAAGAGEVEHSLHVAHEHAAGRERGTGEALIEADFLGRIAGWNHTAEDLFGWTQDEVAHGVLTVFFERKHGNLVGPLLVEKLLVKGVFRGRAVCYDRRGLPVACEVELSKLGASGGGAGRLRGRFRPVTGDTLLPRERIHFGFARLYAFSNPVKPAEGGKSETRNPKSETTTRTQTTE
jgi:PAS domain-containing protein